MSTWEKTRWRLAVESPEGRMLLGRGSHRNEHAALLGTGWQRVSVLTRGWVVGLLSLGSCLLAWTDPSAIRPARCVPSPDDNRPIIAIAFRADDGLALASRDHAWRIVEGCPERVGSELHGSRAAFSSDGALLAVGDESK